MRLPLLKPSCRVGMRSPSGVRGGTLSAPTALPIRWVTPFANTTWLPGLIASVGQLIFRDLDGLTTFVIWQVRTLIAGDLPVLLKSTTTRIGRPSITPPRITQNGIHPSPRGNLELRICGISSALGGIGTFFNLRESEPRTYRGSDSPSSCKKSEQHKGYLQPIFLIALGLFGAGYFTGRFINGAGDNPGKFPLLVLAGFAVYAYGVCLLFERILNKRSTRCAVLREAF
jgi:hypothetical protein